jgi:hypothetical protein
MKYFLYREQSGEGCDYTIGCGSKLEQLEATNMKEAIDEVVGLTSENWKDDLIEAADQQGFSSCIDDYIHDVVMHDTTHLADVDHDSDRTMSQITLYEVNDEVDMIPLLEAKLAELRNFQKDLDRQQDERRERAQYEKLKKKFEK